MSQRILESPNVDRLKLYHSASDFTDAMWDLAFDGGQMLMHRKSLLALEENAYRNFKPLYFIYDDDGVQVPVYAQVFPLQENSVKQILNLNGWATAITSFLFQMRSGLSSKKSYLLIFGSPLASGVCGAPSEFITQKPDLMHRLMQVIMSRIEKEFKSLGSAFIILAKDVPEQSYKNSRFAINKSKAHFLPLEPVMKMQMNPQWHSFQDYLAGLSSKYRIRAQSALKKFERVKWIDLECGEIESIATNIEDLYNKVENRAKIRLVRVKPDYFIAMKRYYGADFIFRAFYFDDSLIAFTTGLFKNGFGEAHLIGFDESLNQKMALYQNLLYSFVSDAIHARVTEMSFGRTATEIKSTVGAVPHDIRCASYFLDPGYEKAATMALSKISNEYILRRPFKSQG